MARTPTPLHYYDLGSGQFDETSTYPFTGATPTRLYFGPGGTLTTSAPSATAASPTVPGGTLAGSAPSPVSGVLGTVSGSAPRRSVACSGRSPAPRRCRSRPRLRSQRHPRLEPHRRCLRTPDRPVVDGRHLGPGGHRGIARAVRRRRPARPRPGRGRSPTPRLRSSHPETVAGPITATVYASSTTSETELVAELEDVTPSGASYPLTEGALLGSLRAVDQSRSWTAGRHDRAAVPPLHAGVGQARHARRGDRVPDPDLPDARDDRRRRPPAAHPLRPPTRRT